MMTTIDFEKLKSALVVIFSHIFQPVCMFSVCLLVPQVLFFLFCFFNCEIFAFLGQQQQGDAAKSLPRPLPMPASVSSPKEENEMRREDEKPEVSFLISFQWLLHSKYEEM